MKTKRVTFNPVVPLLIFQTWHTKKLPLGMFRAVQMMKLMHPRFRHHLFDDNDCRDFIKEHFDGKVVHAFDSLIPGAYKADLWRYCVLYIKGGIYIDIKFQCLNTFHLIELSESNCFVADENAANVYNAFMVSTARNPVMLNCINRIVEHVRTKYYGIDSLHPTGPHLLGEEIRNNRCTNEVRLTHLNDGGNKLIQWNGVPILASYRGYYEEVARFRKQNASYQDLYSKRAIYR